MMLDMSDEYEILQRHRRCLTQGYTCPIPKKVDIRFHSTNAGLFALMRSLLCSYGTLNGKCRSSLAST